MPHPLMAPMGYMVLLTFLVLFAVTATRLKAVREKKMEMRYLKTYSEGDVPRYVLQASRNLTNLFEFPVLFYVGCLAAIVTGKEVSGAMTALAWIFVACRYAHSAIHIGPNSLPWRGAAFILSMVALGLFWVLLVL